MLALFEQAIYRLFMDQDPSETPLHDQDFLIGQALIAMPNMGDPRFEKSVVLMCAHDEEHAMGIIVNKPLADVHLADLLTQLKIEPKANIDDLHVFFGGPVQTERGVVLHTLDYVLDATLPIGPDIGLTASKDILNDIAGANPMRTPPRRSLLAIGHAGWGAGQLEKEIALNAWVHCDADEAIIFDGATDATWTRALSRLGVNSAMFSAEWATPRDDSQPLN